MVDTPEKTRRGKQPAAAAWLDGREKPAARPDGAPDVAVALGYDSAADEAPRIVAKGRGEAARKIVEVALANDIQVRRDADLVEILSALEIDAEIPYEAFTAVAEILSYVYQANNRMSRPGGARQQQGETA